MIRTIIVDDEILARIGIRSFIDGKEEIQVIGMFGNAREALQFLRNNITDLVITDIEMSDMNGLDLISVIREENLASGIIILSCHDNFSYAQTAIFKGTNSYLLKMELTEEGLIKEVLKVYKETVKNVIEKSRNRHSHEEMEEGTYVIGIPRIKAEAEDEDMGDIDSSMIVSLLEEVVLRYQMGTLFSPYNRETFIIFRFERTISMTDLRHKLEKDISAIITNVQQYINGRVILGISAPFTDLKKMRVGYDEASKAADLDFYGSDSQIYECSKNTFLMPSFIFSKEKFLSEDGFKAFSEQLNEFCDEACAQKIPVRLFKNRLVQAVDNIICEIIRENRMKQELLEKWSAASAILSEAVKETSASKMKKRFMNLIEQFHREILKELQEDELARVFLYIEQNLDKKISLSELAQAGCMSIPSMSKKFKERTGITITRYINIKRVKKVKTFLRNPSNSLWSIAEDTGFANVNYLVRVFKKVTGITIGEYRKKLGIAAEDEDKK